MQSQRKSSTRIQELQQKRLQEKQQQAYADLNSQRPLAYLGPLSGPQLGAYQLQGYPLSLNQGTTQVVPNSAFGIGGMVSSGGIISESENLSQLRKRESKRNSKNADNAERTNRLLKVYNDLKTLEEQRELANRQLHLRRISLMLVKHREDLYPFPILQFVEETSKIMLMNEIELVYWYHLMKTYLHRLDGDAKFTHESVRLFFFQSAMFVKRFLFQSKQTRGLNNPVLQIEQLQIDSIESYVKTYHYSNFDKAYTQFDRQDQLLLDDQYKVKLEDLGPSAKALTADQAVENLDLKVSSSSVILSSIGSDAGHLSYERKSYLSRLSLSKINKTFKKLREPLETDEKGNIIDYNWHVDGILKNSQSYNKEPELIVTSISVRNQKGDQKQIIQMQRGKREVIMDSIISQPARKITQEDQIAPPKSTIVSKASSSSERKKKQFPQQIAKVKEDQAAMPQYAILNQLNLLGKRRISDEDKGKFEQATPIRNDLTLNESTLNQTPQFTPLTQQKPFQMQTSGGQSGTISFDKVSLAGIAHQLPQSADQQSYSLVGANQPQNAFYKNLLQQQQAQDQFYQQKGQSPHFNVGGITGTSGGSFFTSSQPEQMFANQMQGGTPNAGQNQFGFIGQTSSGPQVQQWSQGHFGPGNRTFSGVRPYEEDDQMSLQQQFALYPGGQQQTSLSRQPLQQLQVQQQKQKVQGMIPSYLQPQNQQITNFQYQTQPATPTGNQPNMFSFKTPAQQTEQQQRQIQARQAGNDYQINPNIDQQKQQQAARQTFQASPEDQAEFNFLMPPLDRSQSIGQFLQQPTAAQQANLNAQLQHQGLTLPNLLKSNSILQQQVSSPSNTTNFPFHQLPSGFRQTQHQQLQESPSPPFDINTQNASFVQNKSGDTPNYPYNRTSSSESNAAAIGSNYGTVIGGSSSVQNEGGDTTNSRGEQIEEESKR